MTAEATYDDRILGVGKLAAGVGNLGTLTRDRPVPASGEVVLEVIGAGVCGTDLHIADGEFPSTPPVIMGHEVAGIVRELGAGVDAEWLDRRVAIETYQVTCGACSYCREGRRNLCGTRRSFGSHVDGGFAPVLRAPVENLWVLPDHLDDAACSLLEPLACVCHCLCDPNVISPGDEVLVTGPGTMGLLAAQVARASGATVTVVGADHDGRRLEAAGTLGFDASRTSVFEGNSSYDVVIECSGHPGGASTCLDAARPGGRYVQVGLFGHEIAFDLDRVCYKELQLTSGFASTPESWRRAVELVTRRHVELDPLVSEVAPLSRWEEIFAATRNGEGIKFVFDPRQG